MVYWQARLSGSFHLCSPEQQASVPRGKRARAILAYLCAKAGVRIRREHLMDLLWGDRGRPQARDSLRQALMEIRRCAKDLIQSDRDCVWVEADQLVLGDDNGEEFLADLDHITPELDTWLASERSRRNEVRWEALKVEAERQLSEGSAAAALKCAEQMGQIDRYHEEWVRLAMRAEFQSRSPGRIDQRFRAISDLLQRELGVEPAGETRALRDTLIAQLSCWANVGDKNRSRGITLDRTATGTVAAITANEHSWFLLVRRAAIAAICTATAVAGAALLVSANPPQKTIPLDLRCSRSASTTSPPSVPTLRGKHVAKSEPACSG